MSKMIFPLLLKQVKTSIVILEIMQTSQSKFIIFP